MLRRQACTGDNVKQGKRAKAASVEVVEEKEEKKA